jgi:hypothetical protein
VQLEDTNEKISHKFWVASSNFFETSLIFYPVYNASFLSKENPQNLQLTAEIDIYDCDGKQVNNLNCSFDPNKISVLEVASLIEGFKFEAGIKHGLVEIKTQGNLDIQCRLNSHSNAALMGNLLEISKYQKGFLPLRLGEANNVLVVVANLSRDVNNIKGKLFLGKRSPEISLELPSGSVRVLSLASEFAECLENKSYSSPGYLRITSKNDLPFAVQILESVKGSRDEEFYSSIQ